MRVLHASMVALAFGPGCDLGETCADCGIQVGNEGGPNPDPCGHTVRTEVDAATAVAGQTAADALAVLDVAAPSGEVWFHGRSEHVTVTGALAGDRVRAITWTEEGDGCIGWLDVPSTLHLASADGTLDERWDQTLRFASPWTAVDLAAGLPVDGLGGTLDVDALAPDATLLMFSGRVGDEGSVGKVELSTPLVGAPDGQEDARTTVVTWDTRGG